MKNKTKYINIFEKNIKVSQTTVCNSSQEDKKKIELASELVWAASVYNTLGITDEGELTTV
jgi:hypothetical protein